MTGTECGYANGKEEIKADYKRVCMGDTGYRETVHVTYDPARITTEELLQVFLANIDPTVEGRQGVDVGEQYQTGIYYKDEETKESVVNYIDKIRACYPKFAVEVGPLTIFTRAEEYHQSYLLKNSRV